MTEKLCNSVWEYMTEKRFKIYNKETWDTYIEDTQDCYSNGNTKKYWFGENEDFCDLFKKLNELSDENEQLKKEEKRLYKYFRKCFDNVSEKGFRETWEVVKKYD